MSSNKMENSALETEAAIIFLCKMLFSPNVETPVLQEGTSDFLYVVYDHFFFIQQNNDIRLCLFRDAQFD